MTAILFSYAVLLTISVGYFFGARWAYRRTGDVSLVIGLVVLYFWTFLGAWPFIIDFATGFQGYRIGIGYYYMMEKMFPFVVNMNYVLSLLAYGLFMGGLFLGGWYVLGREQLPVASDPAPVLIDHRRLLAMGVVAMLAGLLLVVPQLVSAVEENTSFYMAVRHNGGRWASLHALMNGVAGYCLVLGYAVHLGQRLPRALFISHQGWAAWAYPVALIVLGIYSSMLGDRHTILTAFILGMLLLVGRSGMAGLRRSTLLVLICGGSLLFGGWVRAFSWTEITALQKNDTEAVAAYPYHIQSIAHIPSQRTSLGRALSFMWSNEMFAAHFSMFGVLDREVSVAPFISFNYLLHSVIPSSLASRPKAVYDHYATEAGLVEGQGYTIHHATAWWINLGWAGLVIGGAVLGLFWGALVRGASRVGIGAMGWVYGLLPFLFCAFLPQLVRAGPEGYKALLLEAMAMPLLIVWMALPKTRLTEDPVMKS